MNSYLLLLLVIIITHLHSGFAEKEAEVIVGTQEDVNNKATTTSATTTTTTTTDYDDDDNSNSFGDDDHQHYHNNNNNNKCQNILISPLPGNHHQQQQRQPQQRDGDGGGNNINNNNNINDDGIVVSWNVLLNNNKNHDHNYQQQQQYQKMNHQMMIHWGYELPDTKINNNDDTTSTLLPNKTLATSTILRNNTIIYNATLYFRSRVDVVDGDGDDDDDDGHTSHTSTTTSSKIYFQVCPDDQQQKTIIYEATNILNDIECPRLSMFGDLGWSNNQILELTQQQIKLHTLDGIVLFGDMVYYWNINEHVQQFFEQLSNMTTTMNTMTTMNLEESKSKRDDDDDDEKSTITTSIKTKTIVPLLVTPGNGEAYEGFLDYKKRFFMPSPFGQEHISHNQWYSINIGGTATTTTRRRNYYDDYDYTGSSRYYDDDDDSRTITGGMHLIGLSTEVFDYWDTVPKDAAFHMMEWLRRDLQHANLPQQRRRFPWIVVQYHRPSYSTWGDPEQDPKPYLALENIFKTYKVDVVFAGHVHNMEITTPVYMNQPQIDESSIVNTTYIENAIAPIHVISGNPSNFESTSFFRDAESWTLWRSYMFGHATIAVGPASQLKEIVSIELIHSATKQVAHRVTVAKNKSKEQLLVESKQREKAKKNRRRAHETNQQRQRQQRNTVRVAQEDTSCMRNQRLREIPVGSSVVAAVPSSTTMGEDDVETSDAEKNKQQQQQRRLVVPPEQQLTALRAIYDTLGGPSWLHRYGWESSFSDKKDTDISNNNSIHPCDWYGVTCDAVVDQMLPNAGEGAPFGITAIMLPSNNVRGDIGLLEDAFTALGTSLQILDLSSNLIYGELFDLAKALPYVHTIALSPWSTKEAVISGKPSLPLNTQYGFMERMKLNGTLPDLGQLQCYAGGSMYENLGCLLWFINTTNITGPVPESVCYGGKRYNEIYLIGTQVNGGPCLGGVTSYHTQQECDKNISCPPSGCNNNDEDEWYYGQRTKPDP